MITGPIAVGSAPVRFEPAGRDPRGARPEEGADHTAAQPGSQERTSSHPLDGLTAEDRERVQELARRDREVRTHEQAHLAASGGFARGGARFSYVTGPDGRRYVVEGSVSIDSSPIPGNPEATLRKMEAVKRAALAPAHPSAQDRSVAAAASQRAQEAREDITEERLETMASRLGGTEPERASEATHDGAEASSAVLRSTYGASRAPAPGAFLDVTT